MRYDFPIKIRKARAAFSNLFLPTKSQIRLKSDRKIIFSGIQPTGIPHLGNYFGALKQWQSLQAEASESCHLYFSIVDLHAITALQDPARVRKSKRETLAALLAIGLNPERCTIFYQSTVAEHAELMWILSCFTPVGHLSRMTQWKTKNAQVNRTSSIGQGATQEGLKLGLLSYPVLQAADILLYHSTHVPVGDDQIQHVEFTRDIADSFNALHGNVFKKPEAILAPMRRVMSLREPHSKMSKSHADSRSRILISDSPEEINLKIRLALTDSLPSISYDPRNRPGVSNLLDLMACVDDRARPASTIAEHCKSMDIREFKKELSASLIRRLAPYREKYQELIMASNSEYLEEVICHGMQQARGQATRMLSKVRQAVGII